MYIIKCLSIAWENVTILVLTPMNTHQNKTGSCWVVSLSSENFQVCSILKIEILQFPAKWTVLKNQ